jgi:hypothetical protein
LAIFGHCRETATSKQPEIATIVRFTFHTKSSPAGRFSLRDVAVLWPVPTMVPNNSEAKLLPWG